MFSVALLRTRHTLSRSGTACPTRELSRPGFLCAKGCSTTPPALSTCQRQRCVSLATCQTSKQRRCVHIPHTIPYPLSPCHAIPYHTIPYHTIPYHTIPYPLSPYHTIPYHTIPHPLSPCVKAATQDSLHCIIHVIALLDHACVKPNNVVRGWRQFTVKIAK